MFFPPGIEGVDTEVARRFGVQGSSTDHLPEATHPTTWFLFSGGRGRWGKFDRCNPIRVIGYGHQFPIDYDGEIILQDSVESLGAGYAITRFPPPTPHI